MKRLALSVVLEPDLFEPCRWLVALYPAGFVVGDLLNKGIRSWKQGAMEHGSLEDSSASTFSIMEEDHTLANSVRFVLNQE